MYKVSFLHTSFLFGFVAIVLTALNAEAQQQTAALMTSMATNASQLKQYTFKQRTELYYERELKNTKLDEIHYSTSGERVTIPLHEQTMQSESPRRGPGHRIIAKKLKKKSRS